MNALVDEDRTTKLKEELKQEKEIEQREKKLIIQMSLFDDLTEEDINKVHWVLRMHPKMLDIIKNYEFAKKGEVKGLNEYDLATAEGRIGKKESALDLTSDVTANTIVLKDKRQAIYKFYKERSRILSGFINNIRDPHESMISNLLFVRGWRSNRAQGYLTRIKKTDDIYPIGVTTFFEKRRKAIRSIANSLKMSDELDMIIKDDSPGRSKDGEYKYSLMEWQ